MKVLIAHNRYRSSAPSGENQVVDAEIELLRSAGLQVVPMLEDSNCLNSKRATAAAALGPVYSAAGVRRFRQLLAHEQPDVVHLHNVFPLISPAVVRVAVKAGVPVVQTVHNYRQTCVNGLHFRDGESCVECVGRRLAAPAIRHGCYRGSRAQSVPMVVGQSLHRGTWTQVSRYLALTPFMADALVTSGIPSERVTVRPSWVVDVGEAVQTGRDFLFVGRLDEAKGVRLLLQAWQALRGRTGRVLRVVGDGSLTDLVRSVAARDSSVHYLGRLDATGVARMMAESLAVLIPSLWFEGFPLVMAEAFARGRAVVVVHGGSPASVVGGSVGWRCDASAENLARTLLSITDEEAHRRGKGARRRYEEVHSPEAALRSLLAAYDVCDAA